MIADADSLDQLASGQVVKALFYDPVFGESVSQSVSRMSAAPTLLGRVDKNDPAIASLLKSPLEFTTYRVGDVAKHVPLVFFSSGTTGHPKGIEISDLHVQLSGLV